MKVLVNLLCLQVNLFFYTVSPLHTNLQAENFSHMQTCVHMSNHGSYSHAWCTLSRACILYKWLCFCVLYCTVLYRVQQYNILISSPGCPEASVKAVVMQLVLLYFSRYHTVKVKMFSLFFVFVCFLCIICVKSIINLLHYSTIQPIMLVGYLG